MVNRCMYIPLYILSSPALPLSQFDTAHKVTVILNSTSSRCPFKTEGFNVPSMNVFLKRPIYHRNVLSSTGQKERTSFIQQRVLRLSKYLFMYGVMYGGVAFNVRAHEFLNYYCTKRSEYKLTFIG